MNPQKAFGNTISYGGGSLVGWALTMQHSPAWIFFFGAVVFFVSSLLWNKVFGL